jgi:RluA family pseudouridine synthase
MNLSLLQFLRNKGHSNSTAKKMLKSGKVRINGVPTADGGRIVNPSDVALLHNSPRMIVGRDPVILHRDSGFVVVWKPGDYLSVPARNRKKEYSVITFVHRILGQGLAVHRLDEGTSGLMLVATEEATQKKLKDCLEQRLIHRHYLAIANNEIKKEFTVDNILVRNRGDGLRGSSEDDSGKDARTAKTHFRPVEKLHRATLVEATLETGRTHQIRIHLAESGHPVLGDPLYSPNRIRKLSPRLALHAWKLRFPHPYTGKEMEFMAPLADDLERLRRDIMKR